MNLQSELRGFKFVAKVVLEFKKIENDDEAKYSTFYSNLKAETIINESYNDNTFESIYIKIISNIQFPRKGLGWITDSVIDQIINFSKQNGLAGSSYRKLPKEIDHSKKDVINIQTFDNNKSSKWCLVRYLHPECHHPAKNQKG